MYVGCMKRIVLVWLYVMYGMYEMGRTFEMLFLYGCMKRLECTDV